jgi:hypothetical protein
MLLSLLACTTADPVADYLLNVVPVVPANQAPFDHASDWSLTVDTPGEPLSTYDVGTDADFVELPDLAALQGTRLVLQGWDGDDLTVTGHAGPLDLVTGNETAWMVIALQEQMAWLDALQTPLAEAAVAIDAAGRAWAFGGDTAQLYPPQAGEPSDAVLLLDLSAPDGALVAESVATLPEFTGGLQDPVDAARIGHTATALADGTVLIAGGHRNSRDFTTVTDQALIWDGDALTFTAETMPQARSSHDAVVDANGNVFLVGGHGPNDDQSFGMLPSFSVRTADGAWVLSTADLPFFGHAVAVASVGTLGALACGGMAGSGTDWTSLDRCFLLYADGSAVETSPLPTSLAHAAALELPGGRVLLTGGIRGSQSDPFALYDARETAFVYDLATRSWTQVGALHHARAWHALVPDGHGGALVVGGTFRTPLLPFNTLVTELAPLACVERYDPELERFVEVDLCSEDGVAGSLAAGAWGMGVATSPDRGALIVGGYDGQGKSLQTVSWWPAPAPTWATAPDAE